MHWACTRITCSESMADSALLSVLLDKVHFPELMFFRCLVPNQFLTNPFLLLVETMQRYRLCKSCGACR